MCITPGLMLNSVMSAMYESQVSGCQLENSNVVKAHRRFSQVSPCSTRGCVLM
jgi:hypothetical protein